MYWIDWIQSYLWPPMTQRQRCPTNNFPIGNWLIILQRIRITWRFKWIAKWITQKKAAQQSPLWEFFQGLDSVTVCNKWFLPQRCGGYYFHHIKQHQESKRNTCVAFFCSWSTLLRRCDLDSHHFRHKNFFARSRMRRESFGLDSVLGLRWGRCYTFITKKWNGIPLPVLSVYSWKVLSCCICSHSIKIAIFRELV